MTSVFLFSLMAFVPIGLVIIVYLESKTERKSNGHIDHFVGE